MTVTCGIQPTSAVTMAIKVLNNTCNMCIHDFPDKNTLITQACGPQALDIHIRQILHAHVSTIIINIKKFL